MEFSLRRMAHGEEMIVEVEGRRVNLLQFSGGPFKLSQPASHGAPAVIHDRHGVLRFAHGGEEIVRRWNTYYAMYCMLK